MYQAILTTHDLAIGYAGRRGVMRCVAEGLNLILRPGQLVCLLGPNGAGKSTLLRSLAGMQAPLHGTIRLNGADPYHLSPRELAQRLGVVLTERAEVAALSVRALVALGRYPHTDWSGRLTEADQAVIDRALSAVGISDFAHRSVHQLSDGERQKVMIARALAQEPQLLLLDEPTAFLDLPRRVELMGLLRRLARGTERAVLLSTHDLDLALHSADQIWLFSANGVMHIGTPEELVLNGAFQAAFPSDEVHFDAYSGTFRFKHPHLGTLQLRGGGLAALWTQRALEREGFAVNAGGAPSSLCVAVSSSAGQIQWHVEHEANMQTYTTLAALLERIRWHHA